MEETGTRSIKLENIVTILVDYLTLLHLFEVEFFILQFLMVVIG